MRRTKRPSLFWLLALALALLWQQVALATVICPDSAPVMAAGVARTTPADCMSRGQADQVLCASHCSRGTTVQSDARSPQVPASLLPPLAPALPVIAGLPLANASLASVLPRHGNIPPRRLLFCSLLI